MSRKAKLCAGAGEKRSLQIEPSAMQALLRRLPLDIRTIQTEMEKLELYGGVISGDVERLVTQHYGGGYLSAGQCSGGPRPSKSFHMWQDLCGLNKDTIYLIALLAAQFRFLP